jgi:hypothetical protein
MRLLGSLKATPGLQGMIPIITACLSWDARLRPAAPMLADLFAAGAVATRPPAQKDEAEATAALAAAAAAASFLQRPEAATAQAAAAAAAAQPLAETAEVAEVDALSKTRLMETQPVPAGASPRSECKLPVEPGAGKEDDQADLELAGEASMETQSLIEETGGPGRPGYGAEPACSQHSVGCKCSGHCSSGHRVLHCPRRALTGSNYCKLCSCCVPECKFQRYRGSQCRRHMVRSWGQELQLCAILQGAGVLELMFPCEVAALLAAEPFVSHDLLLELIVSWLSEPLAVELFVQALLGEHGGGASMKRRFQVSRYTGRDLFSCLRAVPRL